jgi:glycosyltransferase involved in cell wall biosynthesis
VAQRTTGSIERSTGLAEPEADRNNPVAERTSARPLSTSYLETAPSDPLRQGVLRALVLFHETDLLGASTSVLRVMDELYTYGWSMSSWVPGAGPLLDHVESGLPLAGTAERPIAVSGRGWRKTPGAMTRLRRTPAYLRAVHAALLRTRPHVVHANTLHSLPEAVVARRCGLPVVLQSHELPESGLKRDATVMAAARVADVLVGVSEAVSSMLRRHAWRTPVHTVLNGVPPSAPHPTTPTEFIVGSVGTVSWVKGTDVFLRAAALTRAEKPEIRFEHVGSTDLDRDVDLREPLVALLGDDHVRDGGVTMLGVLPAETVLPRWSVLVSSSRSDGFPLATLEAMAAGIPVVATAVGGVPEQIEHLVNGILVRPDDAEAISTWVLRLHADSELRHRLGSEARRRALAEFTTARQADGLHRAYLTALTLRLGPSVVRRSRQNYP